METRFYPVVTAMLVMVIASLIYGLKFFRKRNYLLAFELWVVMFSGSNFLVYAFTNAHTAYLISYFCDAFSRGFGIPVITTAGLMAVTHGYRPSVRADIAFFALAVIGALILVGWDFIAPIKPYFYLAMWTLFSIFLVYFVKRLLSVGERLRAMVVFLAMGCAHAIAIIYDFYKIPGDAEQLTFYTFAALTWGFLGVALYYGYCGLERAAQTQSQLMHGRMRQGAERYL